MKQSTGLDALRELNELGIDKSTLVVFTSDNSPWQNLPDRMLQAGNERWHAGNAGLLRGRKEAPMKATRVLESSVGLVSSQKDAYPRKWRRR